MKVLIFRHEIEGAYKRLADVWITSSAPTFGYYSQIHRTTTSTGSKRRYARHVSEALQRQVLRLTLQLNGAGRLGTRSHTSSISCNGAAEIGTHCSPGRWQRIASPGLTVMIGLRDTRSQVRYQLVLHQTRVLRVCPQSTAAGLALPISYDLIHCHVTQGSSPRRIPRSPGKQISLYRRRGQGGILAGIALGEHGCTDALSGVQYQLQKALWEKGSRLVRMVLFL